MVADELGMRLHDRSTMGEVLTMEEQGLLDAWYAEKDGAEAVVLERRVVVMPSFQMLQVQLDLALAQLAGSIGLTQQISVENDRLR
jgi:hypothetical protein